VVSGRVTDGCCMTDDAQSRLATKPDGGAGTPLPDSVDRLKAVITDLQQELIACQRLALLGSLTAMVTHEFNNLLTPIMARAEAALLSGDDLAFMRKALERTLVQSRRAKAVAELLLELAHRQQRPLESCSVAEAVREAVETMARPLEKDGIQLQVAVPEELRVRAHFDLLCQVLLNLLLNARRSMQDAGGMISITAVADGDKARIEVRDSGKGIPRDVLDKTINPFLAADPQQTPNDWQQVGLGLSVCRTIARSHGATIAAMANEGRGCTFQLCWPIADPKAGRSPRRC